MKPPKTLIKYFIVFLWKQKSARKTRWWRRWRRKKRIFSVVNTIFVLLVVFFVAGFFCHSENFMRFFPPFVCRWAIRIERNLLIRDWIRGEIVDSKIIQFENTLAIAPPLYELRQETTSGKWRRDETLNLKKKLSNRNVTLRRIVSKTFPLLALIAVTDGWTLGTVVSNFL